MSNNILSAWLRAVLILAVATVLLWLPQLSML